MSAVLEDRDLLVYGLGNAIVDRQHKVSDVEIEELRLHKGGMQLVDQDDQARILRALGSREGERHAGGSGANSVVAIAQLGGKAGYACAVGNDADGSFYADSLRDYGVELSAGVRRGATGTSVILITPDGERTMNTHLGVSVDLQPGDVDDRMIARARMLYVEGYLFTNPGTRDTAFAAMSRAKQAGTPIALSFSDGFVVQVAGEDLARAVREFAPIVFANDQEAAAYTGAREPDAALERIVKQSRRAIVTHGAEGAWIHLDGRTRHVHAFPATPVDTTGAGDLYAAGVLYATATGMSAVGAALLGGLLAHRVVMQMGARLCGDLRPLCDEARRLAGE